MHHFNSENATESDEYYGIDPLWSPSDKIYPARDAERSQHSFDQVGTQFIASPDAPIGLFDSGAGGLTILSALRQELPYENYIYFGDTAHCPYGLRSDAEVIKLSSQASQFLIDQGAKLIVVACNTASQTALNTLRATFAVPFVGVVPAVKPAARATKKGVSALPRQIRPRKRSISASLLMSSRRAPKFMLSAAPNS